MKQTPGEQSLANRLGPSRFSAEGFLGTDPRPVDEIVAEDLRTLEKLGVRKDTLVQAMTRAYEAARAALGAEVAIRPGVAAVFHESMGRVPSPFQGDGVFEKGEAELRDAASGRQMIITRLGLALIEKHDFFQGRGSHFRIEPADAAFLLDLAHQV